MKVWKLVTGVALVFGAPLGAMAAPLPLEGDYRLDFFASNGACEKELFIRAETDRVIVKLQPEAWGSHYRIGSFCRDRNFGEPRPVETCSTYVETNTLTDDGHALMSVFTGPVSINGKGERRNTSRFDLSLESDSRLKLYKAGYDREGVNEQPVARCFYDRVN